MNKLELPNKDKELKLDNMWWRIEVVNALEKNWSTNIGNLRIPRYKSKSMVTSS